MRQGRLIRLLAAVGGVLLPLAGCVSIKAPERITIGGPARHDGRASARHSHRSDHAAPRDEGSWDDDRDDEDDDDRDDRYDD